MLLTSALVRPLWSSYSCIISRSFSPVKKIHVPIYRALSTVTSGAVPSAMETPEKPGTTSAPVTSTPPKQSLKEKTKIYLKSLYKDYRDVYFETLAEGKAKPKKSTFYIVLMGGILYCIWSAPNEREFAQDFKEARQQLELCAASIRNPDTEKFVHELNKLEMKGLLRHQNLGLFSIMWQHNEDDCLAIYSARCPYLQPLYSEMWDRLVDVGFCGRWWILKRKMEDYDVNYMEWEDNLLGVSWHDSSWIPILNAGNVLDYFSERSNPFYDRTCNNEIIKMQRLNPEQLNNMTGLEYILLHVQEPILYVIRKQHRHSASQVTPISDYYIIAGVVYQAPDLGSVVNSRLLSTVNHMQSAFDEVLSYSRYHPSKGYTWEFKDKDVIGKQEKKKEKKEEPSSLFQRQRIDMLLVELSKKFPLRVIQPMAIAQPETPNSNKPATPTGNDETKQDVIGVTIKTEPQTINPATPSSQERSDSAGPNVNNSQQSNQQRMKPPPEKKPRLA